MSEPPLPASEPADDEVLCHCSGTRRAQIRALHAAGMDMQAISRWTGALSGCGGCEWDIRDFLQQEADAVDVSAVTGSQS